MVRCQGYRYFSDIETKSGCMKTSGDRDAINWGNWQLCYDCARILHPEYYKDKPHHGTGENKLNVRVYEDLVTIPMLSVQ